jgi:hypothetical protein
MERVPVLECLLPGAGGHLRLCLVLSSIKWPCFSKTPALMPLAWYLGYLRVWLPRAQAHAQSRCEGKFRLGWQVMKYCLLTVIETGKRTGTDCSRV